MKKINKIMIFLSCILSVAYSLTSIREGDIYNILIRLSLIPVVLLPTILRKLKIEISDASETIFIIFVFVAQFLGSIVGLYNQIYWLDTFSHFLSGIVFSFFILEILIRKGYKTNIIFNIIFIIACTALIAVSWEIFEFINDSLFGKDAQKVLETGVNDTMKDMIVALLGSILFCLSYLYEYLNNKKLIVLSLINNINR